MFVDSTLNMYSDRFMEFLACGRVELKHLLSMKLDRHILSETGNPDNAFKLIFILQEQLPHLNKADYVLAQDALDRYVEWYDSQFGADGECDDAQLDSLVNGPKTWSAVTIEDVEQEDLAKADALDAVIQAAKEEQDDNAQATGIDIIISLTCIIVLSLMLH